MKTLEKNIRLVFCFTRGKSLRSWDQEGILEREVLLYQKLQQRGINISFITYGDSTDLKYTSRFPGIKILCNRWNLSNAHYEYCLPVLHAPWLWRSHVIKSNQVWGADVASRLGRLWHKPFIARCGYLLSDFMIRQHGKNSLAAIDSSESERKIFSAAQKIVVTTPMMADDVSRRVPSAAKKTLIIPNYVDTQIFQPKNSSEKEFDLIFVGRLVAQKNTAALLNAVAPLNIRILLIGDGELRTSLQKQFAFLNERIHWKGNVPHAELPAYLNRSKIFILASHYEGHPKALLEAMSCGLSVIGTNVEGIREVIRHNENGLLCTTEQESIRAAIQQLLSLPKLRIRLGQNARQYVLEQFSIDKIAEIETALLREVAAL